MKTLIGWLQSKILTGSQITKHKALLSLMVVFCFINSGLCAVTNPLSWQTQLFNAFYDTYYYIASDTEELKNIFKNSYNKDGAIEFQKRLVEQIDKLQMEEKNRPSDRDNLKRAIETLGRTQIGPNNKTLNDHAQEFIIKHCPSLIETDYMTDPFKTISYYICMDIENFIEEVRIIRGPMGEPMTLMEAMQYYKNLDPQKAETIRHMIQRLIKSYRQEPQKIDLDILLESIKDTQELLKKD